MHAIPAVTCFYIGVQGYLQAIGDALAVHKGLSTILIYIILKLERENP